MENSKQLLISVLKHYGVPENRDEYLALVYAGAPPLDSDGELPPELEAELPSEFQRSETGGSGGCPSETGR